jgi:hypothetical protein
MWTTSCEKFNGTRMQADSADEHSIFYAQTKVVLLKKNRNKSLKIKEINQ